jgi:hypothetical protein
MPGRVIVAAGAALVLAGLVTGIVIDNRVHSNGSAGDPRRLAPPCATQSNLYLQVSDLGAFDVITDQTYQRAPFHGQRAGATPLPFVTSFLTGRLRGYVADLAVTGPYRKSEDDFARSLGYPIGKWPLVPLQGPVVQANPGLLEVYQTNWVFTSEQGATAYMGHVRSSIAIDPNGIEIHPTGVGTSVVSYDSTLGPADALHERVINIASRQGKVVVQIAFQGGQGLSENAVVSLMQTALLRLATACPTTSSQ